jgi:molybdopterin molybdotransferase
LEVSSQICIYPKQRFQFCKTEDLMITVAEAKKLIFENTYIINPARLSLDKAAGLVLSKDLFAVTDIPAYAQSSMDGYALSFGGWKQFEKLKMAGIVAAGSEDRPVMSPEQAVRIFTGAAVPEGADTVVIQEKSRTENGELIIEDNMLEQGANVRPKGSEIKAGDLALPKNSRLSPAAIGFLTGIGITHVDVYPAPSVSIIVTGNELQDPGKPLKHGQVYESNSYTLRAVLQQMQIKDVMVYKAEDTLDTLTSVLSEALAKSDIVLLNGGISVGDYDFVLKATENCGVTQIFHKIKQKPGKPIYFGKKGQKLVFGLPGNPASVLTCFYEYVTVALEKLFKCRSGINTIYAPLSNTFKKPAGLTHFLKGFYDGKSVTPLDAQESFRLSSFARANCLIVINEEVTESIKGEIVEVHLLPV